MSLDGFLAFLEERPKGERWELDDGVPLMRPQPTRRHDLCTTPAPLVVFEVLSPSDRPRRRASKLAAYAAVTSIGCVVLVRQDRHSVMVHRRNPEGGPSPFVCTDTVDLPEVGVTLTFETI